MRAKNPTRTKENQPSDAKINELKNLGDEKPSLQPNLGEQIRHGKVTNVLELDDIDEHAKHCGKVGQVEKHKAERDRRENFRIVDFRANETYASARRVGEQQVRRTN